MKYFIILFSLVVLFLFSCVGEIDQKSSVNSKVTVQSEVFTAEQPPTYTKTLLDDSYCYIFYWDLDNDGEKDLVSYNYSQRYFPIPENEQKIICYDTQQIGSDTDLWYGYTNSPIDFKSKQGTFRMTDLQRDFIKKIP